MLKINFILNFVHLPLIWKVGYAENIPTNIVYNCGYSIIFMVTVAAVLWENQNLFNKLVQSMFLP